MLAAAATLTNILTGRGLSKIERREYDWAFEFGARAGLTVSCPWRILVADRIALTDSDHGHKFGLPAPVDGEKAAQRLLAEKVVQQVSIRTDTGDLSLIFSEMTTLEVLNMSAGYEGWEIGVENLRVIALGGGELAIFTDKL